MVLKKKKHYYKVIDVIAGWSVGNKLKSVNGCIMSYCNVSHYLEGEGCSVWQFTLCKRNDVRVRDVYWERERSK